VELLEKKGCWPPKKLFAREKRAQCQVNLGANRAAERLAGAVISARSWGKAGGCSGSAEE